MASTTTTRLLPAEIMLNITERYLTELAGLYGRRKEREEKPDTRSRIQFPSTHIWAFDLLFSFVSCRATL